MKVAVTGGAGFIGSHVVDRLILAGHNVVVVDKRQPYRNDVAYQCADVLDGAALRRAFEGCGAVFHLAGVANVNDAATDPVWTTELNVTGTARVWEAARDCGVNRSVLASTVWVYGAATDGTETVDETAVFDLTRAGHIYTASKLAAELVVHSCHELYGQEFTILRYGIPFGPRMRDELVIARFVRNAFSGAPIVVHGDGSQYRNYIYVEDLADAHVLALGPAGANQTFNLEGQEPVTVRELVLSIAELVPGDVEHQFGEARAGDYAGRAVSAHHADAVLGWRPRVPFADGLRQYVDWHLATQSPPPRSGAPPWTRLAALRRLTMQTVPLVLAVLTLPALAVSGKAPLDIAGRLAVVLLAGLGTWVAARSWVRPVSQFAGVVLCAASVWLVSQASGVVLPFVAAFLGVSIGLLINHRGSPRRIPVIGVLAAIAALLFVGTLVSPVVAWWAGAAVVADGCRSLFSKAVREVRGWPSRLAVDAGVIVTVGLLAMLVGATSVRAGWFSPPLRHGSRARGEVALTFDASDAASATLVGDALEKEHVTATFFIAGKDVQADPGVARAILDRAQLVGNATYDRNPLRVFDPRGGKHVMSESVFRDNAHLCPAFLQPPYGFHTPLLALLARHRGIAVVAGDVAVSIRRTPDPAIVTQRVLAAVRAGSIVRIDMTHGGQAGAQSAAASVPTILQGLRDRNLRPVTLDVLLGRPSYVQHC